MHSTVSYYFTQQVYKKRVLTCTCMHNECMGLYGNLTNIPKTVFKRGSRINTDRFPKRAPKAQAFKGVRVHASSMAIFLIFKSPGFWVIQTGYWPVSFHSDDALQIGELLHSWFQLEKFLRATRGACNPNFQVVIKHVPHVCSQHSFELPLRVCGMHRTQFDHTHLDFLSLIIWSCKFDQVPFWPSVT